MDPVVHFEIPYNDSKRISKFYKSVFGWNMTHLGEAFGNYILAETCKIDAKPGTPAGAINGGFYPVKANYPQQYPSIVIGVKNIYDTMELIIQNGGEVLGKPYEIPNFGLYVSFTDTEGNRNSIIQPIQM